MLFTRRKILCSGAPLVLGLAGGACRGARAADELVLLNEVPVRRVDPRYATTTWELRISRLLAPGLAGPATLDGQTGPGPGLAEWFAPVSLDAPTLWHARIHPAARFPNGRPVEAEDVRYTFDSIIDPNMQSPLRASVAQYLVRIDVIDARTVAFVLRAPSAAFASHLDTGIVDRHAMVHKDDELRRAVRAGRRLPPLDLAREVVGAGAYQLAERTADRISLRANPHAGRKPASPRLTVRSIPDDNARVLALMGGSGDLIVNGVTPMVLQTLQKRQDLHVVHAPSATVTYLGFNLRDPALQDPTIRRALARGIDREGLIAGRFDGRAALARSLLPRTSPFCWSGDSDREGPDENPDQIHPGRLPPRLTLRTSSNRARIALAQAMARQLSKLGVDVQVRPFEFATLMHDIRHGNFQMFLLQLTGVIEPDMLRQVYHSGSVPDADNQWAGLNRFAYRNPRVDAWLDEAVRQGDPDRRRTLYHLVQQQVAADLPLFPLWHEDNVIVHRHDVTGITLGPAARLEGLLQAHRKA